MSRAGLSRRFPPPWAAVFAADHVHDEGGVQGHPHHQEPDPGVRVVGMPFSGERVERLWGMAAGGTMIIYSLFLFIYILRGVPCVFFASLFDMLRTAVFPSENGWHAAISAFFRFCVFILGFLAFLLFSFP